jgi:hypothetical protein
MEKSGTPERQARHLLRILRPLFWWLILVLVLYGIRTHQRLMEETRLNFNVTMQGQAIAAAATFDGKPAFSGQNIPLGNHTFAVRHPKGEPYSTNMFVWYGPHNLGDIALKRAFGNITITVTPPADWLIIRGPEWSATLKDSSGTNATVPTDTYNVEADFPHWRVQQQAFVVGIIASPLHIAPLFGAAQLGCNQPDATFQVLDANGQSVSEGTLPATVAGLPAGSYRAIAAHHGNQRIEPLTVKADATNTVELDFSYGKAVFETAPNGAAVTSNGRYLGATPLTLPEIQAGSWAFSVQREGYEPATVTLAIVADQTTTFQTNLTSVSYTGGMRAAQQYMSSQDYDQALAAVGNALIAKPGDADALALQRNATGFGSLKRARALGEQGDFMGGEKELAAALLALPGNSEATTLLAEYKQREPEQKERLQQEKLAIPREALALVVKSVVYGNEGTLFEEHELKAGKPVAGIESAIISALQTGSPAFQVRPHRLPWPDSFAVVGRQEFSGGVRQCVIVGAQTGENETRILFTVMEYKTKHDVSLNGGLTFNTSYVPLHPSEVGELTDKMKTQIAEGIQIVTGRIQQAIGQ